MLILGSFFFASLVIPLLIHTALRRVLKVVCLLLQGSGKHSKFPLLMALLVSCKVRNWHGRTAAQTNVCWRISLTKDHVHLFLFCQSPPRNLFLCWGHPLQLSPDRTPGTHARQTRGERGIKDVFSLFWMSRSSAHSVLLSDSTLGIPLVYVSSFILSSTVFLQEVFLLPLQAACKSHKVCRSWVQNNNKKKGAHEARIICGTPCQRKLRMPRFSWGCWANTWT